MTSADNPIVSDTNRHGDEVMIIYDDSDTDDNDYDDDIDDNDNDQDDNDDDHDGCLQSYCVRYQWTVKNTIYWKSIMINLCLKAIFFMFFPVCFLMILGTITYRLASRTFHQFCTSRPFLFITHMAT
jgi:hypothetical protein